MTQVAPRSKGRLAGVGALVAVWTLFDALVLGVPILIVVAVSGRAVGVFLIGGMLYAAFNLGSCRWIERQWDIWIVESSLGRRLELLRTAKRAQRPIAWITDGSASGFAIAAVVLSASEVIALHRLVTGASAGRRRVLAASVAPALVYTTLCTALGWLLHTVLHL